MTRAEAEEKILAAMKQVEAVRREYCPEDGYLTLFIQDGCVNFNNTYWEHEDGRIEYFESDFMGGETNDAD